MRETLPPEMVPRLDDAQAAVVAWLRSPEGETWTRERIGFHRRLNSHGGTVYLAELIPQSGDRHAASMRPPEDPAEVFTDGCTDRGVL